MFGIGLPELILIMGIALIVVGPEKLPELAKGLAKQVLELKKAANVFKDSLKDEVGGDKPWEKDLPMGFSRPEELAAAGRDALEKNNEQSEKTAAESAADSENDPYPDTHEDEQEPEDLTENDAGENVDG